MSLRVAANALKERVSSNLSDVKRNMSDSVSEVKHGAHHVAERIGDGVDGVVDILPTLPNIPNPLENIDAPVVKRGAGAFKLTMLQEARRQDDPTYEPKGCCHMSKSTERLVIRSLFYFFSIAALTFLILAFVFQFGLGQASQAAIWAISAIFLGGALALNTRIPRNKPNKCVGIAALMISVCSFAAFIIFCIGASNKDLDKLGMGLGIFVTLFATIAAGMWAYNLWFPSKRANAIILEDNQKMLGTFQVVGLAAEQGTLAQMERGTPENIKKLHMACNVITVILWYLFAIIIIFFTFDIRGLVTDASTFTPPPEQRIPITNTTIPPEPLPYTPNTTSPTMEPTSPPPTDGPTLPGETYSPTASPTFIPSDSPTGSPSRAPITSVPSQTPTTTVPSFSPTTSAPSPVPTTSVPTASPTNSAPTSSPTTSIPSSSPTTQSPTDGPTTSSPSGAPSLTPTTTRPSRSPSAVPTSSEPSSAPTTSSPTASPSTSVPTVSPTTSLPTSAPATSEPTGSPSDTSAPTTFRPSKTPTTQKPSRSPLTSKPSRGPSFKPSQIPTTVFPSKSPTNQSPTRSPTKTPTLLPTRLPTSMRPSRSPSTARPSRSPSTARPSKSPATSRPSRSPSTSRPSRTPTRKPTSLAPTSRVPTLTPTPPTRTPTRAPTFAPSASPTKAFVPVPEAPPAIPPGTTIVSGSLHFYCVGDPNARPAVIFEHDIGASLDVWAWVQNIVSNQTYACAYSRRGYGYSTPGNRPRTVAFTSVELNTALDSLNITTPVVLVGHGFAGFQLRRFYNAFPERVAGMVFVDAYSTQCFKKPKCDGKEKKGDSEGYGQLESIIPFGFIRALAYAGISYPGPSGRCAASLPEAWGVAKIPARARFLASILSPAFWTNSLAEDSDMPISCALAAQGPGNSPNNKISVPLTVIISDRDFTINDGPCGAEQKNAGGGHIAGKNREAVSNLFEVDYSSHWSLLCDEKNATFVGGLVNDLVQTVRLTSKNYFKFPQFGRMNWAAANSFCGARGMRLPQLFTSQNQADVDDLDLNKDDDNFWLGATATAVGQPFKWLGSSANINSFYTNWDNKEPSGNAGRTCLEITRSNQRWRAADCSVLRYVMCERDAF